MVAVLVPVLLYAFLRVGYLLLGGYSRADGRWSVPTAVSILHERDTDLDEYTALMPSDPRADYTLEKVGDDLYTIYPLGASLVALPHIAAYDLFYFALTGDSLEQYLLDYGAARVERLVATSLAALSVVLLYLIARRHLPLLKALGLALAYGLSTSIWSTAAAALWQQTPTLLLLTLTLGLLDAARERPERIAYAGLTLALSFLARPTNAIVIALVTVYVAVTYPRQLWRYLAWAAPVAIAFFAYSHHVYGHWLPTYYRGSALGESLDVWEGLAGTLVSPNRGLFVWSPIVLFAFYGAYRSLRAHTFDRLSGMLWACIALHWLLTGSWQMWWGGHTLGPRFFVDVLPFYAYLTIPALQSQPLAAEPRPARTRHWRQLAGPVAVGVLFVACTAWGAWVQLRVAKNVGPAQWNASPVNVDMAPSRLWDWQDVQFLRQANREPELRAGLRVGWWPRFEFNDRIPGQGWSFCERNPFGESFTWMAGRRATFYLEVRRPTDVAISFRVLDWLTPAALDSLAVSIGDTPVALTRTFDEHGAAVYSGVLPAEAFAEPLRYYVLSFTIDQAHSPRLKDPESTDPRQLGLALDWLALSPFERGK
ncbi:MAG: hypothetical protein ABFD20_05260 [Anaerolineales bacterium]